MAARRLSGERKKKKDGSSKTRRYSVEESWRGADHTQTSWGAADRCHESTAVTGTARTEGRKRGWEKESRRGDSRGAKCNEKCEKVSAVGVTNRKRWEKKTGLEQTKRGREKKK